MSDLYIIKRSIACPECGDTLEWCLTPDDANTSDRYFLRHPVSKVCSRVARAYFPPTVKLREHTFLSVEACDDSPPTPGRCC